MSEHQYYEFQAIDRPLSEADCQALRKLSTRARITTSSFTNSYQWGDFKGDPTTLMQRWFDLHLYLANWGARRLMIRLPRRLLDRAALKAFIADVEDVKLSTAGDNLILSVARDEVDFEDWDDGSGWLADLAPLRADILSGDLRLFYLLWLMAVETDEIGPDQLEPMPGLGPLSGPLEAFVDFFDIDRDLVAVAAAQPASPARGLSAPAEAVRPIIAAISEQQKTDLLTRLFAGDAHVAHELRALVRDRLAPETAAAQAPARSVSELRAGAEAIRAARARAQAAKAAAERAKLQQAAERQRRARLKDLEGRGERVWKDIETEIERRNPNAYDKATALLVDLQAIAAANGGAEDFVQRLRSIRQRHARKERFIERLAQLG
ncbi:hypothetical protein [Rhodopseudomonas palustris]|uniref:Uncharacterized protein n=1 Tax=Rhodopseudomonas palustris (strain BisB18) TaxID=316056 RepID=Q213F7_RHOPB